MKQSRVLALHERVEKVIIPLRLQFRRSAKHKDGEHKIICMAYDRQSSSGTHIGDDIDKAPEVKWVTFTLSIGQRKIRDRIDHASYDDAMKEFESKHFRGKWTF